MRSKKLSKSEIVARLHAINVEQVRLTDEATKLWTLLQKAKRVEPPIPLTFSKNFITWDDGQVLLIKGKGYKFLKILYEAKGMRLKEATLDRLIWKGNVTHHNFKEFIRRLAEKLEKAKFPYRLLPVENKAKVVQTGNVHKDNRPEKMFIPSEIIGVKLHAIKICANVAGKE